jgi:hypothetical protein
LFKFNFAEMSAGTIANTSTVINTVLPPDLNAGNHNSLPSPCHTSNGLDKALGQTPPAIPNAMQQQTPANNTLDSDASMAASTEAAPGRQVPLSVRN